MKVRTMRAKRAALRVFFGKGVARADGCVKTALGQDDRIRINKGVERLLGAFSSFRYGCFETLF